MPHPYPSHTHPHHADHEHGKPLIRFDHASFRYPHGPALEDITLEIADGEFVGVIGPNGSGKTTMLRAILGLMPPTTVREAVLMGRSGAIGLWKRPGKADLAIVRHALEDVGMEDYEDHPLGALSGGQQQRVFIARALAQHPQILLLDEPTTGIDTTTQHTVLDLIQRLHEELHLTIVLVSHDINLIAPLAERLALLKTRLYALGTAKEVLTKETLARAYGPQILTTDTGHVIVADHHH